MDIIDGLHTYIHVMYMHARTDVCIYVHIYVGRVFVFVYGDMHGWMDGCRYVCMYAIHN